MSYSCAYCGGSMSELRKKQPSISYAECWVCYAESLEQRLQAARKNVQRLGQVCVALGACVFAAVLLLAVGA